MSSINDASPRLEYLLDRTIAPGYSRLGFHLRHARWPPDDPRPDAMRGRTALVTGANSGIGKSVAAALAGLGGTVLLGVRNRERGEQACRDIRTADPNADVTVTLCDLSDTDSVTQCAAALGDRSLNVLIHNAGVLPAERTETAGGHELTLATHVLGPLLLTDLLTRQLSTAADPRVIFVASGGMYTAPLAVDDPEFRDGNYRGATAYARTKRMQVALTPLLAEHYAPQGISVHSMHPGWVDTPGIATALPGFHRLTGPLLRSPAMGADTAVWLAATDPTPPSGRFWHDRRPRPEHYLRRTEYSDEQASRLWAYCRRAVGLDDS
ncbi:SDR family NAD(P)-dependent oxidoreductase [Nocardia sp. NPDC049190]|uniref:SDR family NAD(P)-dependent oxidoreductase n=1 Tax=Nocardia sp. NPDC049190 TaxID=3155650 RepID=UPI0034107090